MTINTQCIKSIYNIIYHEIEDGHVKVIENWYWGNVGYQIRDTAYDALAIADSLYDDELPIESYLDVLIIKFKQLLTEIKSDPNDVDGYSYATMKTIISKLLTLQADYKNDDEECEIRRREIIEYALSHPEWTIFKSVQKLIHWGRSKLGF